MKQLLDAYGGQADYLHDDPDNDLFHIKQVADLSALIDANRRAYNAAPRAGGEFRRVASLPPIVIAIARQRYGADPLASGNEALLRRMLNDPDLRFFRTRPGRL